MATQPATRTQDGTTYRYTSPAAPDVEIVVTDHGDGDYARTFLLDGQRLYHSETWPTPYPDAGPDYVASTMVAFIDTGCAPGSRVPMKGAWLEQLGDRLATLYPLTQAIWARAEAVTATLPYVHMTTTGSRGTAAGDGERPARPITDGLWIAVTERASRGDTLVTIYRSDDSTAVARYTHPARLLPGDDQLTEILEWLSHAAPALLAARPELARAANRLMTARSDAELMDEHDDDGARRHAAERVAAAVEEWDAIRRDWRPRVSDAFRPSGREGYDAWCEQIEQYTGHVTANL